MRRINRTYARAVLFTALAVAIHLGLSHFYLERVLPLDFPIERDRAFAGAVDRTDIALMGNSHVGLELLPRDIPRSYNFAWLGEGYMVTYYRLQKLIGQYGRPFGTVVLQVEQHSFGAAEMEQLDSPYWARYVDFLDLYQQTGEPWRLFTAWFQYAAFPYAGRMEEIGRYFVGGNASESERLEVMDADFSLRSDPDADARLLAKRLFRGTTWFSDDTVRYFQAILDLCRRHEIRVVLIRFPVSSRYWKQAAYLAPPYKWDIKVGRLLASANGSTVLDYHDLYLDRDDLFMDPHHLNKKGVSMFSARVGQDLRNIGVVRPVHGTPAREHPRGFSGRGTPKN